MENTLHAMVSSSPLSMYARLIVPGAVALIALCFSAVPAGAHSPSGMVLAHNETAGEVTVAITHQVADPAIHHVKEVVVSVGGSRVKNITYSTRPFVTTFTCFYSLQVPAGSSIDVHACM
jgi:hypothetical protein